MRFSNVAAWRSRVLFALAVAIATPALTACGSIGGPSPTRSTPDGTVEWFKNATGRKDYASEWDALSPAFKQRLSQSAGRNVDLGDYIFMRGKLQENPQVRFAEQFIGFASVSSPRMSGPNRARVTAGAMGNSVDMGLVMLEKWELRIIGEPQPYTGTVEDSVIRAEQQPDGSVVVHQQGLAPLTFRKDQVQSYRNLRQWYIDDLGAMEQQYMR